MAKKKVISKVNLKEEFRIYLKKLTGTKIYLVLSLSISIFFLTIPYTIPYPLIEIKPGEPIFQKLNIIVPSPDPYPVNFTAVQAPHISASSAIVVDVNSKAVMYQKNPNLKLYPASTTKMLTALVAFDQYSMDKVASVSSPIIQGQIMFLQKDENITVANLLKGLLIYSANDAAYALADLDPNGIEGFMAKMNRKLDKYGLKDSYFLDPAGLSNGQHLSTVHDLAIIGSYLMENKNLADMVGTRNETVTDVSGTIVHPLTAIDTLLDKVPGLKGIKTGWTENAGECFVSYTERDNHRIITAILGSYDRFGETTQLIEWAYANHQWQNIDINHTSD